MPAALLRTARLRAGSADWGGAFCSSAGWLSGRLRRVSAAASGAAHRGAWAVLVLAGLLVGYAPSSAAAAQRPRVCGIARLSPRSIAATVVFMAAAARGSS